MKKATKAVLAKMNETATDAVKAPKSKKGFTLIEIMVAVAIIGVLSAIAIPTYKGLLNKAKTNKASYQDGINVRANDFQLATDLDADSIDSGTAVTNVTPYTDF